MSVLGWIKDKLGFGSGASPAGEFKSKLPFGLDYLVPDFIEKPVTEFIEGASGLIGGAFGFVKNPVGKIEEWTGWKLPTIVEKGGNLLLHGLLGFGALSMITGGISSIFHGDFISGLAMLVIGLVVGAMALGFMANDIFGNSRKQAATTAVTHAAEKEHERGLAQAKNPATPEQVKAAAANLALPEDVALVKNGSTRSPSVKSRGDVPEATV